MQNAGKEGEGTIAFASDGMTMGDSAGLDKETIDKLSASIEKAREYFSRGKYTLALKEYDFVLSLVPKASALYFERAQVHLALNDTKKALKDISSSAKWDPKSLNRICSEVNYIH